jgi:hypothetical protein
VAPSARTRTLAAAAAILAAGSLAGCITTQQKAARLRLNSARILAGQSATRVTVAGHAVAVARIALVSSGGRTAFAVTVRNPGSRAVSDLPISVGYAAGPRRRVYLNAGSDIGYFDAHLPAIAARGSLTWVYTAARRLPPGARPFALVGGAPAVSGFTVGVPPVIRAGIRTATGSGVAVAVRNLSGVPQYQLPVYAVAERHGRAVAAGEGTVEQLAGNSALTVRLRLLGRAGQAPVWVQAAPTIFN